MQAKRRAPQVSRGLNTFHWVLLFAEAPRNVYRVHTVVRGNDDTVQYILLVDMSPTLSLFFFVNQKLLDHIRNLNQLYQVVTVHSLEEASRAVRPGVGSGTAMCARAVLSPVQSFLPCIGVPGS
jgi:hypothetical protein